MYTDLKQLAIKRLVREIKDNQLFSIALRDDVHKYSAHSLRDLLESLGAEVRVEEIDGT